MSHLTLLCEKCPIGNSELKKTKPIHLLDHLKGIIFSPFFVGITVNAADLHCAVCLRIEQGQTAHPPAICPLQ